MFFLIDTENWEITNQAWLSGIPRSSAGIIYGMHLKPQTDNLFCAIYMDGLITTLVYNWDDMTSTKEFTNQTIRSIDGMNSRFERYVVQPLLANEHLAIIFSDNAMFLFDRNDATLIKSFEMEGEILHAWWADQDEDIVAFLMDNGQVGLYDLEHGDGIWEAYSVITYDQDDILHAVPVNGGICTNPQNGMYLTVSKKNPDLLQVRQITDPGLEYLMFPEDTSTLNLSVQAVPSGERILIFCPLVEQNTLMVVSYDAETGAEMGRCSFDVDLDYPPVVMDDTHFIAGCKIYDLDTGNWEYLEGLSEESPEIPYEYYFRSIRLADGSVLTAETISEINMSFQFIDGEIISEDLAGHDPDFGMCSCWLDGKQVPESVLEDTALVLPSTSVIQAGLLEYTDFKIGANGWILAYGTPGLIDKADPDAASDGPSFIAFHATDPARKCIEDPYPQDEKRIIAMGTQKPVFACVYSDGQIFLFDMDTGSAQSLETRYSPREIQSVCFSEGDEYLLVLTMSARLDIYNLSDGSVLMSEVMPEIKKNNESSDVTYGIYTNLSCLSDPEHNRLHVFASKYQYTNHCWACIDTDDWIMTAHADDIYTWIRENESLYGSDYGPVFLKYPMYSLEDLSDWARKELQ